MKINVTKNAERQFAKLPHSIAARIISKMYWYAQQKDPLSFAEPLHNSRLGEYRFRIGDYRVFCDVQKGSVRILIILDVRKRDHAYD